MRVACAALVTLLLSSRVTSAEKRRPAPKGTYAVSSAERGYGRLKPPLPSCGVRAHKILGELAKDLVVVYGRGVVVNGKEWKLQFVWDGWFLAYDPELAARGIRLRVQLGVQSAGAAGVLRYSEATCGDSKVLYGTFTPTRP